MRRPISTGIATTVLAVLALQAPAQAGTLSGTADAPARELGRVRLQPAGQPPFRFSIPYRDSDVWPGGHYTVRATVRQGDRLLFTTRS